MKTEITTRDEQIDGTWCDVPYVTIRKSEFDTYRNAVKDLLLSAELSLGDSYAMHLELAIETLKKLEGGEA